MKLFFETSGQSVCFLLMIPVGFLLALLLDADVIAGRLRSAADIALLLLAGAACLWLIVLTGERGLRVYHVLGLLSGAVLYLCGIGRVIRILKLKIRSARQEKDIHAEKCIHSEGKE